MVSENVNRVFLTENILMDIAKNIATAYPFTAEQIYQNLKTSKDPLSVHLCDYPKTNKRLITTNRGLVEKMELIRSLASTVHNLRAEAKQPLRQKMASVVLKDVKGIKGNKEMLSAMMRK